MERYIEYKNVEKTKLKERCLKIGLTLEYWIKHLNYYTHSKKNALEKKEIYVKNYGRNPRGALAVKIKNRIEDADREIEKANYFIELLQE